MKKIISLLTALSIVFSVFGIFTVFAGYTEETMEISTLAELEAFRDSVNAGNTYEGKAVRLTADIDMSEKYGEGKESWTPIGINNWETNTYKPFLGNFDGGNHTISGLYAYTEAMYGKAVFFDSIYGTLKSLNIKGTVIANNQSDSCAAGIAANLAVNAQMLNCSFEGLVKSPNYSAGGLVSVNSGLISDCCFKGKAEGMHLVAGIAGTGKGTIINCTNEGEIIGTGPVGGIAGSGKTIKGCVNKGSVTGRTYTNEYFTLASLEVGGIAGTIEDGGSVENCYNTGAVSGNSEVGGIVGVAPLYYSTPDSVVPLQVKNCYNTGSVTSTMENDGEHNIGAVIGSREYNYTEDGENYIKILTSEAADCYYLTGSADKGCGGAADDTATALTIDQFGDKSNFTNWDFDTVWEMDAAIKRPVLRSNREEHPNKTDIAFEVSYYTRVSCADEGYVEIENPFVTPYVMKITSAEQLKQYWENEPLVAPEVPSKYDDAFFENNFLYAVNWMAIDGPQHEISSVYYDGEKINIMWTGKLDEILGPGVDVSCLAVVECANTYREMEFQIKTGFEISYYDGKCCDEGYDEIKDHFTTPYAMKITSADQLSQCTDSAVTQKYTDDFFANNFLIAVNWKEPGTELTHEITPYDGVDRIAFKWRETEPRAIEGAVSGNFFALIECSNERSGAEWVIGKEDDEHSGVDKVDFEAAYYPGICRGDGYDDIKNHFITPYIMKITSAEQLNEAWSSDYSAAPGKYDNEFFKDKFLLALSWNEYTNSTHPVTAEPPQHSVSSVYIENGILNILWQSPQTEQSADSPYQSYIALVECPNTYRNTDYKFLAREEKIIELSFGNVSCKSGDTIDVPLIVSNNPGIIGIQTQFYFDKDLLTPVSVETAGGLKGNDKFVTTNMSWWENGANPEAPNYVSVSSMANTVISGDGEVFILRFKVNENAPSTITALRSSSAYFGDSQNNEVDSVLSYNGSVSISGTAKYPYTINAVKLTDENGNAYENAPADKSFIVDVDITKNEKRTAKDYFVVAVYGKDGSLLSMNYMNANIPTNESFSCRVNIPKLDKEIGCIKAFVWSTLGNMMPLAEYVQL